ncbi:MAG: ArsA family ATPase [Chloroherpetonaceae bacterium]|nr:ArsA family ATPase [Chloroherpetonaceae bacterium]MCS7211550.1 ArsA family ATPase [Chloroherpetonaceae bacterium]MDW8020226.1 ArsA family ATPase [Chloroherpetonaceae bacterium]MDW8465120.1 ArsA family ATPase [Chloroherpetonaceae bacterium]
MRIIFFTGKGGVGKTSSAAATALRCAELGYNTVVMSTDPAHSLADSLGVPLSGKVQTVLPRLDAVEVDPYVELNENWGAIRDFVASLLITLGAEESIAGELASIPGMAELFSLLRLRDFYSKGQYDVVVVDMAPTGETLRLLSLPEVLAWLLKVTRVIEKYIMAPVLRPISKVTPGLDKIVAPEHVAMMWDRSLDRLKDIREIMDKKAVTSARLVMNPEKMVIAESQRAMTYLNLYGMHVDAAIVNRVIPEEAKDGYYAEWYASQKRYLEIIENDFSPMPIFRVPLFKSEVTGIDRLRLLAEKLYGDVDPAKLLYEEKPIAIRQEEHGAVLRLKLPFAPTDKIQLSRLGATLTLRVGTRYRDIVLPDSLAGLEPQEALMLQDGYLEIKFVQPALAEAPSAR